jgi:amino-acid N-acetyltransferase
MVKHLIGVAEAPLYLECLGTGLAQFYGKFGFKSIALEVIAPGLQPKFRFSQQVAKVFGLPLSLMHYQPELEESQSGAKQLGGNQ